MQTFRISPGVVVGLALAAGLTAPRGLSQTANPFTTPGDVAAGAQIFRTRCTGCHGKDGSGGSASDLTKGAFRYGASDEALYRAIAQGIAGTPMPAFDLNGQEIWRVVAYVRSLNPAATHGSVQGDAQRGAALFRAKGCAGCHASDGEGGVTGPDLSRAGSRLSPEQMTKAISRPDEEVSPDYWSLRGKTKSGEAVGGMRLNEDTFSFQILDPSGRLVSVLKSSLAEYEVVRKSPMPSFQGKLAAAELEDLVAYLSGLRGEAGKGESK